MKKFETLYEEITAQIKDNLPKLSPPNLTNVGKRNANDNSKIAGKYNKGVDNFSKPMVSQQDREANQEKGKVKKSLDDGMQNKTIVLSRSKFDRLLNNSGGRTLNLDDGEPKTLNSKTSQYSAVKLPDGRIQITKLRNEISN